MNSITKILKKLNWRQILKEYWPLLLSLMFWGLLFGLLLSTHMLQPKADGLYSGGSTWGDLAYHLSLISNFGERGLFATISDNPLFSGKALSYPFLPDLLTALLVKLGISLRLGLILPVLTACLAFIVAAYFLVKKITNSRLVSVLVPFLFFFNGTLTGLKYFVRDWSESGLSLGVFLNSMTKEYAHLADYGIRFSNIICDYILPQRAFVFGLAIGTVALWYFWAYWNEKKRKDIILAGIFVSLLPLVHAHSFVALNMAAIFLMMIDAGYSVKVGKGAFIEVIKNWAFYGLVVAIIGMPQWMVINPTDRESFIRFVFGWMSKDENFIVFWFKNLNPHILIILIAVIFARPKLRTFWLAFLGIFMVTNLVLFQPHDYDNMKLMLWWYLISMILVADFLVHLGTNYRKLGWMVAGAIFISMTLVGAISVYRESYVSWNMFTNEDLALAKYIKEQTPKDALFLTSDRHNSPVTCLAGRRIMMGYRGWLWTHGIDYSARTADITAIYSGTDNARQLISDYGINYILIEAGRTEEFRLNLGFIADNFPLVYQSRNLQLYRVGTNK